MRLHHCVLAQDFTCGLCMQIIPVRHGNGYCWLFMRIPLRILYAGIPYAWRRPWRAIDLMKRKEAIVLREGVSDSRERARFHPSLLFHLDSSSRQPFNGLGFRTAGMDAGPVAGRKSELVKSLGGHSDHANWRAYAVPIRTTTRCRSSMTRLVFDFSPWRDVNMHASRDPLNCETWRYREDDMLKRMLRYARLDLREYRAMWTIAENNIEASGEKKFVD